MSEESPLTALQSNTRELANDILTLADLQLQLFAADGREMGRRAAPKLVAAIAGLTIAMSSLPLFLVGLAYTLVELAGFPIWLAMLCSAVAGIIIGGATAIIAVRRLKPVMKIWKRSAVDLRENVDFLKETLKRPTPEARGQEIEKT